MALKPSQILKSVRQRNYLAKDFDGLRENLLNYARLYYADKINDFSESSLGGLFLDMAAYIGDNLSFYLDHQFSELDPENAVEVNNIQKHLKSAGVNITGASPARVICTFLIEVPATIINGKSVPNPNTLPIIKAGSTVSSLNGITFELMGDIDFSLTRDDGVYVATVKIGSMVGSEIKTFILSAEGECISGNVKTYVTNIGNFQSFRKITLPDLNISEIIKVYDGKGNVYYEVNDLSEDVVYVAEKNVGANSSNVSHNITLKSAPYRYTKTMEISSRFTVLTFGGGNADSLQDDIIPDASTFAIPLPNNKTFSRVAINPQKLLSTRTLGIATENTSLTIIYRYGGGLSHNVSQNTINRINNSLVYFPQNPEQALARLVTNSLEVINLQAASDGEDAPTINDLKQLTQSIKNSQQRIVTKEDLLSRIYTMPANFGKVFRAAVGTNYNNPYATSLYIISRDNTGRLIQSSDNLKMNLAKYLNEYRMISDAVDILDAPIINFTLTFGAIIDSRYNATQVNDAIKSEIKRFFETSKMQINKPINISELQEIVFAVDGVISLPEKPFKFTCVSGTVNNKTYSSYYIDLESIKFNGYIIPPEGGIFELKYPDADIQPRK